MTTAERPAEGRATPAGEVNSPKAGPGSARHSAVLLGVVAGTAVLLFGLADGPAVAGTGLALLAAAGFAAVRYAAGGGAADGGHRRRVRLLAEREPALGHWEWAVHNTLGPLGDTHFGKTLRPELQRLFAARLAEHHGVDLHHAPARARRLVGPGLWPWLDPAAPPPEPVLPESVLRALLDRLDALGTLDARGPRTPTYPEPPSPNSEAAL